MVRGQRVHAYEKQLCVKNYHFDLTILAAATQQNLQATNRLLKEQIWAV